MLNYGKMSRKKNVSEDKTIKEINIRQQMELNEIQHTHPHIHTLPPPLLTHTYIHTYIHIPQQQTVNKTTTDSLV